MKEDSTDIILRGPDTFQKPWKISLGRLFFEKLNNVDKDLIFMIDAHTRNSLSYGQLLDKSIKLAEILKSLGCGKDTVLGISSENNLEFYVIVLSCLFIGSILSPINPMYTATELKHILNITKPSIIFCSTSVVRKFLEIRDNFDLIVVDTDESIDETLSLSKLLNSTKFKKNFQPLDGDPHLLKSFIMCSSGTTGLPKGVLLSHQNISINILTHNDPRYKVLNMNDTVLGIMPFIHSFGLNIGLVTIFGCNKMICFKKFNQDLFLKSIQDHRISFLWMAPTLCIFLTKSTKVKEYDLSSVRIIAVGAAPMKKSTEIDLKKIFQRAVITQGYGMTETTLSVTKPPNNKFKEGSVGKLVPLMSCKVVDQKTGRSLSANQVGEIWLKGPNIMLGYYGDVEATSTAVTKDGWLKTGDLGYYDDEEFFFIVDRIKELIKYKGYQVAPAEIEALLLTHPKIQDAGVVGLPDEESGELPLAFVVAKGLTEDEVQKFVERKLSPQKWLRGGVRFVEQIPKTFTGKILRKELRKLLHEIVSKL